MTCYTVSSDDPNLPNYMAAAELRGFGIAIDYTNKTPHGPDVVVASFPKSLEVAEPIETTAPSPRPWHRNPAWASRGSGEHPSPILGAGGEEVIGPSEWLTISEADIDLIIAAVNAYEVKP